MAKVAGQDRKWGYIFYHMSKESITRKLKDLIKERQVCMYRTDTKPMYNCTQKGHNLISVIVQKK